MSVKFRLVLIGFSSLIFNGLYSQKASAQTLTTPPGWQTEKFTLPPDFAAGLPVKGTEELRFSPEWAKKHTAGYWSYCFLWTLQGNTPATKQNLESWLKDYYTGLIKSNLEKVKIDPAIATPVAVTLHYALKGKYDEKTFEGKVSMLDYMTQEPITLNIRIRVKQNSTRKALIYFEVSPQQYDNDVWVVMDGTGSSLK